MAEATLQELQDKLPRSLLEVLEREGYSSLNYIQLQALKLYSYTSNLLIVAPTGSGKTEAAVLPILKSLLEEGGQPIYALYITPLRALNRDINLRMRDLFVSLGFSAEIRHGDTPQSKRRKIAESPPHFLITTPETLQFLIVDKRLRTHLPNLRWVVVDELHELIDDKRGVQLAVALERLRLLSKSLRVVALSATLRDPSRALEFISGGRSGTVIEWSERKAYRITIADIPQTGGYTPDNVPPELYSKVRLIADEAAKGGVIVFTNTRDTAELLGRVLSRDFGLEVRVHHGSLSREEREEAESMFKSGKIKAVVATSSLELGIDIGYARLVVQFGSPRQAIKLVQRVGRARHKLGEVSEGIIIPLGVEDAVESAVLARRAVRGDLESLGTFKSPLDVLAHQVAGLVLEYREVPIDRLYAIVTRAYPYRELSYGALVELLRFMDSIGIVRLDGDRVRMGRRTISYYYGSASMIPDNPSFDVEDLASRRVIGHLDYSFASMIDRGKVIILSGRAWEIEEVDVERNKTYVTEHTGELGEPPIWTGMLLPVEWRVAREVGAFYRRLSELLPRGREQELFREYKIPDSIAAELRGIMEKQLRLGILPTENSVVVEVQRQSGKTIIVCHTYLGTRGNNLLALLLAFAIRGFYGFSTRYYADPYRVFVYAPSELSGNMVEEVLRKGIPWALERVREAVRESNAYLLELLHVATRMGVIDRSRGKVEPGYLSILKKRLRDTPVDVEAVNSCLVEHFDLEVVEKFARSIEAGKRKVYVYTVAELSPLSQLIFEKPFVRTGVISSGIPISSVLTAVLKRLESTRIVLYCMHCGEWSSELRVQDARNIASCPKCGSRALAALRPYEAENIKIIRKWRRGEKLTREEEKFVEKARQIASLFMSYGYPALLALAGHGIGPSTAKSILSKSRDEETLVKNILLAEANYTRTRRYWED
ncbi:DEAD/DEAH box helicase [Infirmifilum lucidum]|uniref:DEAD/DEAH box helicase n=1 Tax=Infirmifilum lucidum TaxID=2776706 RepID=A0A7L9FHV5_9CREN|nr:DEAD/DEAH box helicase [Infirmifilum lucidum]QOJ79380.1 DEAD/DEAH box helicase [Infirmifilum lucidum]